MIGRRGHTLKIMIGIWRRLRTTLTQTWTFNREHLIQQAKSREGVITLKCRLINILEIIFKKHIYSIQLIRDKHSVFKNKITQTLSIANWPSEKMINLHCLQRKTIKQWMMIL
jgi:hypothetical protein